MQLVKLQEELVTAMIENQEMGELIRSRLDTCKYLYLFACSNFRGNVYKIMSMMSTLKRLIRVIRRMHLVIAR